MTEQNPQAAYSQFLQQHQRELLQLQKKRSRLGWIRLVVFLIMTIVSYQVFAAAGWMGIIPLITGIAVLLFLVSKDVSNNQQIKNTQALIAINEDELKLLRHDFHHRYDGSQFLPDVHDYANDLDLFGKASLYQWMNRCHTQQGRTRLANNLLQSLDQHEILQRHEAIRELAPEVAWRQQFQAFSAQTEVTLKTEKHTQNWLQEPETHFTGKHWKPIVWIYTTITLATAVATILGYIPAGIFSFLFGVYLTTSLVLSRNTVKPYLHLSGIVKEISTLEKLINRIEQRSFSSSLLKHLQQEVRPDGQTASKQVKELRAILDRFDMRLNIAGLLFLNSFLLWDVLQMIALNEWRRRNKTYVQKWFAAVAEMEVLNTLAAVHFSQPSWQLPAFSKEDFCFRGRAVGHPLIPSTSRVTSDFFMQGKPKIALVTGSNMAGKSTFLRSLGINTILAQMGAPVCAQALELSPLRLMSSMRIADNLAENTSTFYAELKKLKTIIEAVNRGEHLLVLLDEILRGTNSYDRHTGSAALVEQMIRHNAVAVIATHDVELATLQSRYPAAIENYHFDVQVEGEELYFDYRLKPGVCTSLNASILMKKIGIELEKE